MGYGLTWLANGFAFALCLTRGDVKGCDVCGADLLAAGLSLMGFESIYIHMQVP